MPAATVARHGREISDKAFDVFSHRPSVASRGSTDAECMDFMRQCAAWAADDIRHHRRNSLAHTAGAQKRERGFLAPFKMFFSR